MLADRTEQATLEQTRTGELERALGWASSLPWVVERPADAGLALRTFVVDCEPLARRRLWLVAGTGPTGRITSLSVLVPPDVAGAMERLGWASRSMPWPNRLELVKAAAGLPVTAVVALVLTAYEHATR